jgi:hypothetical protein
MPAYPTGGADQYYVNEPQHGTYHGTEQFDLYNPHQPSDPYDQSDYRVPYQDEPSYSLPQGQSMEPLGPSNKEEVSFYADAANPIPREPRYVNL